MTNDWVELAVVTQPHGVRGQVKIKSFTEPVDGFAAYAELTDASGLPVKLTVQGTAQGLVIATIAGVQDRNAAEAWRGRKLGVPRAALTPIATDKQFYIADLHGMAVISPEGAPMGRVVGVANFGAGDLLEIEHVSGEREFYVFTDANFPTIDIDAGHITLTPPDILPTGSEEEETT